MSDLVFKNLYYRNCFLADRKQYQELSSASSPSFQSMCKVYLDPKLVRESRPELSFELVQFLLDLETTGKILLDVKDIPCRQIRKTDILSAFVSALLDPKSNAITDIDVATAVLSLTVVPIPEITIMCGTFLCGEEYGSEEELLSVVRLLISKKYPYEDMTNLLRQMTSMGISATNFFNHLGCDRNATTKSPK